MARAPRLSAAVVAAVIGVLVFGASVSAPAGAKPRRGCRNADVSAQRLPKPALRAAVVCLINAERAADGLQRLRESRRLDRAAQRWADSMVAADDFGHGSGPAARVSATGFRWSAVGENLASGFATPRRVVAAWMGNAGHCQIILNPLYTEVGTGVNRRPVRGYASGPATWAQDFALPAGRRAPSHNWGPAERCH
jgi:uncharacterized protein YkwD